ncbi:MAG TPA: G5 domain-containing protein, partial [Candidatus Saccharimonadales bacterium]
PRAIADQAGVTVYPADDVTTEPDQNFVENGSIGSEVVIDPATPINLNLYGTPVVIRTHASTVADLIKQENIHLSPTDQIIPAETTPLTPNMQVFIIRQGVQIQTVTQTIAMPIQTIDVSDLAFGTSSVVQQGSAGEETITYQENTQNGVVVSTTPIQTVVTTPPVTEIVDEGTSLSGIQGDMALAGISPSDYTYVDFIVSHESGWCPTKWQGDIGYCPATFTQQYANDAEVGYGLCQSTPPDKMAQFGSDWQTNPITQLEWCSWYAESRYGSWYNAYIHWTNYDSW